MVKTEILICDRTTECVQLYKHVITDTPEMDKYGRWKIGLYPTKQDIEKVKLVFLELKEHCKNHAHKLNFQY